MAIQAAGRRTRQLPLALALFCALMGCAVLASNAEARPHASVFWSLPHAGLLLPASASAAESTLEVNVSPDPVESITTQIGATGSTEMGDLSEVSWSVHPAGGTGCGPNPREDAGAIATISPQEIGPFAGEYSQTATWTPKASGSYLLCGWLLDWPISTVKAHTSLPFSVRAPHLSVSLKAPATVRVGRRFHVTTTAQAEAPRKLYEYIIPSRGGVCPANAAAASSRAHVIDPNLGPSANVNIWSVNGGPFSKTSSESFRRSGAWLVCAYFQYGNTSNPPEASASAAIRVLRPPFRH
jgi:hypothetical protein